jgi:hypothetical protein
MRDLSRELLGNEANAMANSCPECGAALPEKGSCRDLFHALLLLEWQIPGGPGSLSHFFAVATYGLQHPGSMDFTAAALAGMRAGVADLLDGHITIEGLLRRMRGTLDGAVRVTRRTGDPEVAWRRGDWPMTVADVLTVEPDATAYGERVLGWARSVRETLDRGLD